MKKYIYTLALASAFAASACHDDETLVVVPDDQKEAIAFSMSDGSSSASVTRAVTPEAFANPTRMVMHIRTNKDNGTTDVRYNKTIATTKTCTSGGSEHSDIEFENANKRYWDDAFGRQGYLSVYAVAIPGSVSAGVLDETKLTGGASANTWNSCADGDAVEMTWAVTKTTQTETTWSNEDLAYSNNIQKTGKDGRTWYDWGNSTWVPAQHEGGEGKHGNGCLQFELKPATPADPTGPGYFDKGHLKFYHALTRMTVKLVKSDGYTSTSPGQFTHVKAAANSNIKLLNMFTSGKLNMKNGAWTKDAATSIDVMVGSTTNAFDQTYKAQMLPDYEFVKDATTANVMEFEIDNNMYYITQAELYKALCDYNSGSNKTAEYGYSETKFTMMQGICYNFTIKVAKKQIEAITATILPWDQVRAEEFGLDNSHIGFSLYSATGDNCTDIKFLRHAENLGNIYTDDSYTANDFKGNYWMDKGAATLTEMAAPNTGKYATNWYYENNSTAYHFRTLNSTAYGTNGNNLVTDTNNDSQVNESDDTYFKMESGANPDYHWGAPMKTGATLEYKETDKKGFSDDIYKGITSNTSDIKMTELHMTSSIKVILKTNEDGGYINLKDATVTFTQITKNASVDLGTGYITDNYDADNNSQQITSPSFASWADRDLANGVTGSTETGAYTWQFVPQPLVRGNSPHTDDQYVGITIQTIDNNEYFIVKKLSEITATSVTDERNQKVDEPIKVWYPGHEYTYTFVITKKGIDAITATVAKWVEVKADDVNLDLES